MKLYIALLALTVVVVADHHAGHDGHSYVVKTHEDLLKFRELCVSKLNIPSDLVEKYKQWQYPDDEKTHCYLKCIFEEFGFFDEQNGFDVEKIHHQLVGEHADHNDETHTKIQSCADKNEQNTNACSWAYRGGMCFIKENLRLVKASVKN